MNLREAAARDLERLQQRDGDPFFLTAPTGYRAQLNGFTHDISQTIDPETGARIAARATSVSVSERAVRAAGFADIPSGETDARAKPWVVEMFDHFTGRSAGQFRVIDTSPDRTTGNLVLILEWYAAATPPPQQPPSQ